MKLELKPIGGGVSREIKEDELSKYIMKLYKNHFFGRDQSLYIDYQSLGIMITVKAAPIMQSAVKKAAIPVGMLTQDTDLEFSSLDSKTLKIKSTSNKVKSI